MQLLCFTLHITFDPNYNNLYDQIYQEVPFHVQFYRSPPLDAWIQQQDTKSSCVHYSQKFSSLLLLRLIQPV